MEKLTDREVEVMMAIWNSDIQPVRTGDILRQINRSKRNSLQTLQVVLRRLEEKGVISHEKAPQTNFYRANIFKDDYIAFALNNFINHHFQGSSKLLLQFAKNKGFITDIDLQRLLPE